MTGKQVTTVSSFDMGVPQEKNPCNLVPWRLATADCLLGIIRIVPLDNLFQPGRTAVLPIELLLIPGILEGSKLAGC